MARKSEQLSFNVSARTARLIGRENVATSEGALIELVKNTYDADSDYCVVYFKIPYEKAPKKIDDGDFIVIQEQAQEKETDLEEFYEFDEENESWERATLYIPSKVSTKKADEIKKEYIDQDNRLQGFFRSLTDIYIIDNGEGMSANAIKKNWMTIGTDNKAQEFKSSKGRTKSGEKGIGRFALDRLGESCELTSVTKSQKITWEVDWEAFDQADKKISDVYATLNYGAPRHLEIVEGMLDKDQLSTLKAALKNRLKPVRFENSLNTGTIIKISTTRDHWDRAYLKEIMSGLEALVPPEEDSSFQLFLFNDRYFEINGLLRSDICDDFDYKLEATVSDDLEVKFDLYRREFRVDDIPNKFFNREFCKSPRYSKSFFKRKKITFFKDIGDLLPGYRENPESNLDEIGGFSSTFYFLKRSSSKKDSEKYYLKTFTRGPRAEWLDNNSGIKLFRDNFRVRPYGEMGSSSWDWLDLGNRVALDPAPAKRKGHWKVSPQNISGVISISRVENPRLADKSSREGLLETDEFKTFRELILAILKVFEYDRSSIFSELDAYWQENAKGPSNEDVTTRDKARAKKLAEKIYSNYQEKRSESSYQGKTDEEAIAAALLKEQQEKIGLEEELDDMREENSLLRVFASSGITIASFTHELENLQTKLGDRYTEIKNTLEKYINHDDFSEKDRFKNPLYRIKLFEQEDKKLKNWLQYTLRTVRKDKRNRRKIKLKKYFELFALNWEDVLEDRHVSLKIINKAEDYNLRAYEIDLDCIFNNLLINSLDAFLRQRGGADRVIIITISSLLDGLHLKYSDKGPGLSKDIRNPDDVFNATFTTKRDKHGKEVGTGMGMWLLKKTLEQYDAEAQLGRSRPGFSIDMLFPHKYENKR